MRAHHFALGILTCLASLASFASAGAQSLPVVASKNFPESVILAEICAQLIEDQSSLKVARRHNLQGTSVCFEALKSGQVAFYPEYTGTILSAILRYSFDRSMSPSQVTRFVSRELKQKHNVIALAPLGFYNSYAIAARPDLEADTLSELAKYSADLTAGFNHEFLNRPDGWPPLAAHYELKLKDIRGMEHALAYAAIETGQIDLLDAYSTDGKLAKYGLKLLEDDQQFFPPYDALLLVNGDYAAQNPDVITTLNKLSGRIDQATMTQLNFKVEVQGQTAVQTAAEFLQTDFGIQSSPAALGASRVTAARILRLLWDHILMTFAATLSAAVVGIALGVLVTKASQWWSSVVLTLAAIIQTIPSLALLCFMVPIPFLGIGWRSAVAALFLYALLPIIRNTYAGLTSVPSDVRESAVAMGLTQWQMMKWIELPLAVPAIMAGVRTTLVMNIGTATIAAFIGAGGLGELIVSGLSLNDQSLILAGAIPAALLAIACDALLGLLERSVRPRGV